MNLHSTSKGGRGGQDGKVQVIGDVILKGKRHLWGKQGTHYHHGMKAGDNTLNAHCARVLMRSMLNGSEGAFGYDTDRFLTDYIDFLTSEEPMHNDTYAESFHRSFFSNYAKGLPPRKCAGVSHDTPTIGGLVMIVPLTVGEYLRTKSRSTTKKTVRDHLALTHPCEELAVVAESYVDLMADLLDGEKSSLEAIADAGRRAGLDVPALVEKITTRHDGRDELVCGRMFSPACYIDSSWPVVLYLAYKYHGKPAEAMLSNTNLGGENCHRGSVLGSIVGAAAVGSDDGLPFPKPLVRGLIARKDIEAEIDAFVAAAQPTGAQHVDL